MVKEVLQHFGVSPDMNLTCPLCNMGSESIDHLFILCSWSWKIWTSCMGWWEIHSCSSSSLQEWSLIGDGLCLSKKSLRARRSMFMVVVWTVREARNQIVFKNQVVHADQILDLIRFRVA
ncbi:hypothetical protein Dsin_020839 [Dipteronia sinensis]|uniref:Reverse transcriptase zinc-binding domain-containing protein n=1 Tax=Dipteronia sinensis TaxID=43782 RepID=A0AAE0AB74_9ROSI|nr:hypothetical protein Dsin_020839 [Dipteronia sinensis]